MPYDWIEMTNTELKWNPSASADAIDPYEDWEKATRNRTLRSTGTGPDEAAQSDAEGSEGNAAETRDAASAAPVNWQPVYVRFTCRAGEVPASNAQLLLNEDIKDKPTIRLTRDTKRMLEEIELGQYDQIHKVPKKYLRFFVFRPEDKAYSLEIVGQTIPAQADDKKILPYYVLRVGPAIPLDVAEDVIQNDQSPHPNQLDAPVLTAVIDDQIGFVNERFQNKSGSRIKRIWLQMMPKFNTPQINQGVKLADLTELVGLPFEDDAYRKVYRENASDRNVSTTTMPRNSTSSNVPRTAADLLSATHIRPYGFRAGHGSLVMDLAAGYPRECDEENRPIVAVQVPSLATAETWGARLDLFILMGVIRILRWADNEPDPGQTPGKRLPVVINISYGVLAGPKDGNGFLEGEIARLVKLRNEEGVPTFVVWAAGNSYRARTHGQMNLGVRESDTVTLRVQPEDLSVTFTEIWMNDVEKVSLTIAPEQGKPLTISIGSAAAIWDWTRDDHTIGRIYVSNWRGRTRVVLALCPSLNHDDPPLTAPAGAYEITLLNEVAQPVRVMIDVQRDDTPSGFPRFGRQAYLDHEKAYKWDPETADYTRPFGGPVNRSGTLAATATSAADGVVVVGGAFDRDALAKAALYSSSGAGLLRKGPDVSAVSDETRVFPGRLGAGIFSGSVSIGSGTSVAAPQVTRALVERIAGGGGGKVLLAGGISLDEEDGRLGRGVLAYKEEPGRVARRLRD